MTSVFKLAFCGDLLKWWIFSGS